jgi:hypothetical protein
MTDTERQQIVFEQLGIHFTAIGESVPENIKEYSTALAEDIPKGITKEELLQAFKDHRFKFKSAPAVSNIIKEVQLRSSLKPKTQAYIPFKPSQEAQRSLFYERYCGRVSGEVTAEERREFISACQSLIQGSSGVLKEKYEGYLNYFLSTGKYHTEIAQSRSFFKAKKLGATD